MKRAELKKLVSDLYKKNEKLDGIWTASRGAAENKILGILLKNKEEIENNLDIFSEEELSFLSYYTINTKKEEEKNSREKAVKILKQHGVECDYDKEKDDIQIWNNSLDKINIYFLKDKKLSINISSSNQDFENQKKFYLEFKNIIQALEKIKKIDPDLVK